MKDFDPTSVHYRILEHIFFGSQVYYIVKEPTSKFPDLILIIKSAQAIP